MRGYLFDTMAHVAAYNTLPEKWSRSWQEALHGNKHLLLFEPLVAEMSYRLTLKVGEDRARERIYWLKGMKNTEIVNIDDNLAINAGKLYLRYRNKSISLVDAFILSVANEKGAKVFTTDHHVRDAGRKERITIDFLPKEELER